MAGISNYVAWFFWGEGRCVDDLCKRPESQKRSCATVGAPKTGSHRVEQQKRLRGGKRTPPDPRWLSSRARAGPRGPAGPIIPPLGLRGSGASKASPLFFRTLTFISDPRIDFVGRYLHAGTCVQLGLATDHTRQPHRPHYCLWRHPAPPPSL